MVKVKLFPEAIYAARNHLLKYFVKFNYCDIYEATRKI